MWIHSVRVDWLYECLLLDWRVVRVRSMSRLAVRFFFFSFSSSSGTLKVTKTHSIRAVDSGGTRHLRRTTKIFGENSLFLRVHFPASEARVQVRSLLLSAHLYSLFWFLSPSAEGAVTQTFFVDVAGWDQNFFFLRFSHASTKTGLLERQSVS